MDRLRQTLTIITGSALFLITGSVNLQVPLYPAYAATAGYGTGLTSVVFAAYVAGLVPVLIGLGGLSDRVGRRPVLLAGLACAASATAIVWVWPTMQALLAARLLQGVGVGLGLGAGAAYLAELIGETMGSARAATVTAATTSLGFGSGALATSVFLLVHDSSTPPSYAGALALVVVCGLALLFLPRASLPNGIAREAVNAAAKARLFHWPAFPPGSALPGAAIALAWTTSGLVIAIVPSQLRVFDLAAWAGPVLFTVNAAGVLVLSHARRLSALQALRLGFVLLPVGYSLLAIGAWQGWLPLVLVGAAVAGTASYGYTYLGGLTEVSRLGGTNRARVVSGYFLWAYIGFSVPTIAVGYLGDAIGVAAALGLFGVLVGVLSTALFLCSMQRNRKMETNAV